MVNHLTLERKFYNYLRFLAGPFVTPSGNRGRNGKLLQTISFTYRIPNVHNIQKNDIRHGN